MLTINGCLIPLIVSLNDIHFVSAVICRSVNWQVKRLTFFRDGSNFGQLWISKYGALTVTVVVRFTFGYTSGKIPGIVGKWVQRHLTLSLDRHFSRLKIFATMKSINYWCLELPHCSHEKKLVNMGYTCVHFNSTWCSWQEIRCLHQKTEDFIMLNACMHGSHSHTRLTLC